MAMLSVRSHFAVKVILKPDEYRKYAENTPQKEKAKVLNQVKAKEMEAAKKKVREKERNAVPRLGRRNRLRSTASLVEVDSDDSDVEIIGKKRRKRKPKAIQPVALAAANAPKDYLTQLEDDDDFQIKYTLGGSPMGRLLKRRSLVFPAETDFDQRVHRVQQFVSPLANESEMLHKEMKVTKQQEKSDVARRHEFDRLEKSVATLLKDCNEATMDVMKRENLLETLTDEYVQMDYTHEEWQKEIQENVHKKECLEEKCCGYDDEFFEEVGKFRILNHMHQRYVKQKIKCDVVLQRMNRIRLKRQRKIKAVHDLSLDACFQKEMMEAALKKCQDDYDKERFKREHILEDFKEVTKNLLLLKENRIERETNRINVIIRGRGDKLSNEEMEKVKKQYMDQAILREYNDRQWQERCDFAMEFEDAMNRLGKSFRCANIVETVEMVLDCNGDPATKFGDKALEEKKISTERRYEKAQKTLESSAAHLEHVKVTGFVEPKTQAMLDNFMEEQEKMGRLVVYWKKKIEGVQKIIFDASACIEHLIRKLRLIDLDLSAPPSVTPENILESVDHITNKYGIIMESIELSKRQFQQNQKKALDRKAKRASASDLPNSSNEDNVEEARDRAESSPVDGDRDSSMSAPDTAKERREKAKKAEEKMTLFKKMRLEAEKEKAIEEGTVKFESASITVSKETVKDLPHEMRQHVEEYLSPEDIQEIAKVVLEKSKRDAVGDLVKTEKEKEQERLIIRNFRRMVVNPNISPNNTRVGVKVEEGIVNSLPVKIDVVGRPDDIDEGSDEEGSADDKIDEIIHPIVEAVDIKLSSKRISAGKALKKNDPLTLARLRKKHEQQVAREKEIEIERAKRQPVNIPKKNGHSSPDDHHSVRLPQKSVEPVESAKNLKRGVKAKPRGRHGPRASVIQLGADPRELLKKAHNDPTLSRATRKLSSQQEPGDLRSSGRKISSLESLDAGMSARNLPISSSNTSFEGRKGSAVA